MDLARSCVSTWCVDHIKSLTIDLTRSCVSTWYVDHARSFVIFHGEVFDM